MIEHPWQTIKGQAPAKSNNYKIITFNGHSSLGKTEALRDYENAFYLQVDKYRNKNIEGFFELEARVYFVSMRHDLDNSLKGLLDCLQHVNAIKNDNRCVKITAEKFVDKEDPRIEFRLIEI